MEPLLNDLVIMRYACAPETSGFNSQYGRWFWSLDSRFVSVNNDNGADSWIMKTNVKVFLARIDVHVRGFCYVFWKHPRSFKTIIFML